MSTYKTHFGKWLDKSEVVTYAFAASDAPVATGMAKLVFDNVSPEPGLNFYSNTHKRNVDLSGFIVDVKRRNEAGEHDALATTPIVVRNQLALRKMASDGLGGWTCKDNEHLSKL